MKIDWERDVSELNNKRDSFHKDMKTKWESFLEGE